MKYKNDFNYKCTALKHNIRFNQLEHSNSVGGWEKFTKRTRWNNNGLRAKSVSERNIFKQTIYFIKPKGTWKQTYKKKKLTPCLHEKSVLMLVLWYAVKKVHQKLSTLALFLLVYGNKNSPY